MSKDGTEVEFVKILPWTGAIFFVCLVVVCILHYRLKRHNSTKSLEKLDQYFPSSNENRVVFSKTDLVITISPDDEPNRKNEQRHVANVHADAHVE